MNERSAVFSFFGSDKKTRYLCLYALMSLFDSTQTLHLTYSISTLLAHPPRAYTPLKPASYKHNVWDMHAGIDSTTSFYVHYMYRPFGDWAFFPRCIMFATTSGHCGEACISTVPTAIKDGLRGRGRT